MDELILEITIKFKNKTPESFDGSKKGMLGNESNSTALSTKDPNQIELNFGKKRGRRKKAMKGISKR